MPFQLSSRPFWRDYGVGAVTTGVGVILIDVFAPPPHGPAHDVLMTIAASIACIGVTIVAVACGASLAAAFRAEDVTKSDERCRPID